MSQDNSALSPQLQAKMACHLVMRFLSKRDAGATLPVAFTLAAPKGETAERRDRHFGDAVRTHCPGSVMEGANGLFALDVTQHQLLALAALPAVVSVARAPEEAALVGHAKRRGQQPQPRHSA